MKFSQRKNRARKSARFHKFRVLQQIPGRKVFTERSRHFGLLLLSLIVLAILIIIAGHSADHVGIFISMVVLSVYIIGFSIKFILSSLFPIIILNANGIKFIDTKVINWDDIKSITIRNNYRGDQVIYIIKINSQLITKSIPHKNFRQVDIYCRSFKRKYKGEIYSPVNKNAIF